MAEVVQKNETVVDVETEQPQTFLGRAWQGTKNFFKTPFGKGVLITAGFVAAALLFSWGLSVVATSPWAINTVGSTVVGHSTMSEAIFSALKATGEFVFSKLGLLTLAAGGTAGWIWNRRKHDQPVSTINTTQTAKPELEQSLTPQLAQQQQPKLPEEAPAPEAATPVINQTNIHQGNNVSVQTNTTELSTALQANFAEREAQRRAETQASVPTR